MKPDHLRVKYPILVCLLDSAVLLLIYTLLTLPVSAILLAQEHSLHSLCAVALHVLHRAYLPWNMNDFTAGLALDINRLPAQVLVRFINGRAFLLAAAYSLRNILPELAAAARYGSCPSRRIDACKKAIGRVEACLSREQFLLDPLEHCKKMTTYFEPPNLDGACESCSQSIIIMLRLTRQYLWDDLPTYFGTDICKAPDLDEIKTSLRSVAICLLHVILQLIWGFSSLCQILRITSTWGPSERTKNHN